MKVNVNKTKCIGCGTCVAISPECFEFDAENKVEFKKTCDLNANEEKINQAKEACPVQAIEVTEE